MNKQGIAGLPGKKNSVGPGGKARWGVAISGVRRMSDRRSSTFRNALVEIDPFLERFTLAARVPVSESELYKECTCGNIFKGRFWKEFVIDPAESFYYYWSMLVTFAFYYNATVIILRAVFTELQDPAFWPIWFAFDYSLDVCFIYDIFVKSRLGFLDQGILVQDVKRLTRQYIKSWKFALDLISIVPLELIFYVLLQFDPLLRLNRLLKLWRVMEFRSDSETRTSSPIGFRLFFLLVNIMLAIHINACVYFAISKYLGFSTDEWVYDDSEDYRKLLYMKYFYSFYWSMLTLTAIGDTPSPKHIGPMLYCIVCMLCGVLIFATIFGNIGSMINQMNASRNEFQHDVDAVKRYMDIRKVSSDLQARVIQWFAYTWNNKQSIDDRQALAILPEKLRAEIAIHVHLQTLKRVAIFQDCEPGLLVELVLKLRLQVFSPSDYICKKGDIGKEMYIIKRGKLQVVSVDGTKVFVTLSDGAVFGEVSILNISGNKTGNRRTASVRSVGYSDLFCLSKDDLWDALKEYPEAKKILMERGKQILRKDNLLDEEAARREELRAMSLDSQISLISMEIEKMSREMSLLGKHMVSITKKINPEGVSATAMEEESTETILPAITVKKSISDTVVEMKKVTSKDAIEPEDTMEPPTEEEEEDGTKIRQISIPVSKKGTEDTIHEEDEEKEIKRPRSTDTL